MRVTIKGFRPGDRHSIIKSVLTNAQETGIDPDLIEIGFSKGDQKHLFIEDQSVKKDEDLKEDDSTFKLLSSFARNLVFDSWKNNDPVNGTFSRGKLKGKMECNGKGINFDTFDNVVEEPPEGVEYIPLRKPLQLTHK